MKTYLRILRMLRPYTGQLVFSVVFMIMYSILSTFSLWMIAPFLGTLFASDQEVAQMATYQPPAHEPGATLDAETLDADKAARVADLQEKMSRLTELRDHLKGRIDAFFVRGNKMDSLLRMVVVFFFLTLAKNVTGYLQSILMTFIGQRIIKDLRDALFTKFTSLPLAFFHKHRAGEIISRATNDVTIANKCVNVSFTNLIRDVILILMYFGLAILLSWRLTLIALAVLPLSMLVIVRIGKKLRKYSRRQQEKMANLTSVLHETVYGIRVVKAFAMEKFENAKFLRVSQRLFDDVFKIARMQRLSSPLTEQLSVAVGLFIMWYGGRQVLHDQELPPELFILFLVSLFSLVQPVKELSQVSNAIQEGMAAADRIFPILDSPSEVEDESHAVELQDVRGAVEFQNVTFAYRPGEPVLRGIDLVVAPGDVVALVGSSGAGKSTLVDLIPRFYDPEEGRILIDGHDIRTVKLASLRRTMGIVTQEVILFNDTVRNNIAYGTPDVPQERIEQAARAANAHDFIMQLPEKYDSVIGDRGVKLSGGERQRISIARAILKNPPILIFDEATSALDSESELLVQEAIDRLMRNRTTFVIAHRLSTIQQADKITVLQDGRIVQSGTNDELLAQGGPYRVLYDLQFQN